MCGIPTIIHHRFANLKMVTKQQGRKIRGVYMFGLAWLTIKGNLSKLQRGIFSPTARIAK